MTTSECLKLGFRCQVSGFRIYTEKTEIVRIKTFTEGFLKMQENTKYEHLSYSGPTPETKKRIENKQKN